MIGYIYLTTNLINNKKYIGLHQAEKFEPERYLGSGLTIVKAIKAYGKENFSCELLESCDSLEDLNAAEKKWIAFYDAVESKEFYNIAAGGRGHTCDPWNKGTHQPLHPNSAKALECGRHLPASEKLKKQLAEYRKSVIVSKETREKLRQNTLGRKYIHKENQIKMVKPEELEDYLLSGWELGMGPKKKY